MQSETITVLPGKPSRRPIIVSTMNQQAQRSNPATLRLMADEATDPIIAQALRDLAAEFERIETAKADLA